MCGRLLYRLLPNLGPILGSKMGSRWHQNQKQKKTIVDKMEVGMDVGRLLYQKNKKQQSLTRWVLEGRLLYRCPSWEARLCQDGTSIRKTKKTIADKMEVRMGVGREALVSILAVFWVPSSGIRWGQDGTKIRKNIDKSDY